jgi:hypothetical protein
MGTGHLNPNSNGYLDRAIGQLVASCMERLSGFKPAITLLTH